MSNRDALMRRARDLVPVKGKTWEQWRAIGEAFMVLRQEAMREACTDIPYGGRYKRALSERLVQEGLRTDSSSRVCLLQIMPHVENMEAWRATLKDPEKINHPRQIWEQWNRSLMPDVEELRTRLIAVQGELTKRLIDTDQWPIPRSWYLAKLGSALTELAYQVRNTEAEEEKEAAIEAGRRFGEELDKILGKQTENDT